MFFSFNANKEITKLKSGYYGYSTTVCTTVISAMFFYEEKNLATQALKGLSSIDWKGFLMTFLHRLKFLVLIPAEKDV